MERVIKEPLVLGVGWALLDTLMLLRAFPAEDTKTEASQMKEQAGGPVVRALSVLARLGIDAELAAVVAADARGRALKDWISSTGVGTGHIQMSGVGQSPQANVWINAASGTRTIVYADGGARPLSLTGALLSISRGAAFLHLDGRERQVAEPLARLVKTAGGAVSLDAGGWKPGLENWLDTVDLLIVPRSTVERVTGRAAYAGAAELQQEYEVRDVIVTDREGDILLLRAGLPVVTIPVHRIEAVDPNGAGDAFAGGVLFGMLRWGDPVRATRFGACIAALSASRFGDYFASFDEAASLDAHLAVYRRV